MARELVVRLVQERGGLVEQPPGPFRVAGVGLGGREHLQSAGRRAGAAGLGAFDRQRLLGEPAGHVPAAAHPVVHRRQDRENAAVRLRHRKDRPADPAAPLVPPQDRPVVDEWLARIAAVVGRDVEETGPEACRTAAEVAEELSAYLWTLRAPCRRTA
ncbi:hypothetical protein [Lentzea flaviverrucosa]|uniref:Uncharacterized protein n=1 Tax=Lentzea flaviverrucosa TaxID=200379 RepID=A0A1H9SZU4_9PSEU|nr:hypothetical protein [Lentzea flaviverrucosa]RDI25588.1 hypothetical protein DFR72_108286 [Lentzea flaviverrucosa]SER90347.1 hypothetical protein SAMN05216195_107286 [Lentzea flaviverrucosa]